jgi:hypothetical protein
VINISPVSIINFNHSGEGSCVENNNENQSNSHVCVMKVHIDDARMRNRTEETITKPEPRPLLFLSIHLDLGQTLIVAAGRFTSLPGPFALQTTLFDVVPAIVAEVLLEDLRLSPICGETFPH